MKILAISNQSTPSSMVREAVRVIQKGGLICAPCTRNYRIIADLKDPSAITRLMASKRRTRRALSLVFVPDFSHVYEIVKEVDPIRKALAQKFWPGPLTILFDIDEQNLPRKVIRQVTQSSKKIGIRIPGESFLRSIVKAFNGPVLVTSANREKKSGASSPAQVKKNFSRDLDLFIDIGDLPYKPPSTVVDVVKGEIKITRQGAISPEDLSLALSALEA